MTPPKPLTRAEWLKTPYAGSEAKDPDQAIVLLLQKYGVKRFSVTHDDGPQGRSGYGVRFELDGLSYVVALETLAVEAKRYRGERPVEPEALLKQVKRAVFYTLKTALETSSVFVSRQQLLLPFLEAGGQTLYERVAPHLNKLQQQNPEHWQRLLPAE